MIFKKMKLIFVYYFVLVLLNILHVAELLFKGSYMKKLEGKAKAYYKSKFGTKGLNFMGYDLSEYPGANEVHRKENMQKWDEYYNCLTIQNETLGQHRNFVPEAVLGYEGGFVKFDCKLCTSPDAHFNADAVEWDFGRAQDNFLSPIEFTEHIIVSPEDKSLSMYSLQESNTGQYVCRQGETITAPIFLTVVKADNLTEVHTLVAPQPPYPKDDEDVLGSDYLYLTTVWGDWSHCSRCNKVGRKYKHGYCVLVHASEPRTTTATVTHTQISESVTTTAIIKAHSTHTAHTHKSTTVKTPHFHCTADEYGLLRIFENGIPCQSHILPHCFKDAQQIRQRSGEIMTGYCKHECPKAKVFEVRDRKGNVIETANNSAGIYSMLQSIPPPAPLIVQQVQYAIKGKTVIISCPGNLNTDTPILWQIAGKNVIAELLHKESNGRVYISLTDKIYIQNSKISDSNLYSCWQNDEVAGLVRLVVEKKLEMGFNHHIMLFGIIIILSIFIYVYVKAFFGRKHALT